MGFLPFLWYFLTNFCHFKIPQIPPLLGNSTKSVQLHKFFRDPRGFLLDHYSSYHYTVIQHSPPAHSIARTPSTQPVVHRPPPEQPQQPVKRPPRLVKIFFFFFTRYYYYRMPFSSISPPVIILWWIFSSELILLFPFLTRFVVKQKNNNST